MYLSENIERLRIKGIDLDVSKRTPGVALERAKSGDWTGYCADRFGERFYLHSKYDPKKEAAQFVSTCNGNGKIAVYGFGLGYHIKKLLEMDYTEIMVIDGNPLGFLAMLNTENMMFVEDKRLRFVLTFDHGPFIQALSSILSEEMEFVIHSPSLRLLEQNSPEVVDLLREFKIQGSGKRQSNMDENLTFHLPFVKDTPTIGSLLSDNAFMKRSKRGIIVAAGPSLDNNIDALKDLPQDTVMIAVGTAMRPLSKHGILPDFVIITDPDPAVGKQLEGLDSNVPLIIFPTTHPFSYRDYEGEVWFAFQKGVNECEQLAQELNVPCLETGGSVATAALDLFIQMNCNPIILVGQDLAYSNGQTHASGTMYDDRAVDTKRSRLLVEAWGGGCVSTSHSWNVYRKWIERRLDKSPKTMAINTSIGGARIRGTSEMSLEEALLIPTIPPEFP
ncbi:DUF115 domain-containing protein [Brevibacillus centrosporus]|uniref:motility associated factor glycosyltransferase family protein n=1 Tax=Brevibacillus centrosporus TaxID=54910 RepID=UPI002E22FD55|nr:DUF115 domain-containing protein [Brevibacillus centrosporus]